MPFKNKYVRAESAELILSGENYFEALDQLIDNAREFLHLQVYIFDTDETGNRIADALERAAFRGVKVFVLADAFGSDSFSKKTVKKLLDSGVNFRFFSPVFSSESMFLGRRLHHKITVADKNIALIGGINIADKYRGTKTHPAWLDFAILLKGNSCAFLHYVSEQIFEKKNFINKRLRKEKENFFTGEIPVRFRRNDWIRRKNEIHKSYHEAIKSAEQSIVIVGSYFLPGYFFRRLLAGAAKRGVEIKIILANKSDVPVLRHAETYLYHFLLSNGIKIFEWKPDSVVHGKAMVTDRKWATIGSYNLNRLSHYRSIELNVDVDDRNFAENFHRHLEKIVLQDCTEITEKTYSRYGWITRMRNFIAYHYIRIIMHAFLPRKIRKLARKSKGV